MAATARAQRGGNAMVVDFKVWNEESGRLLASRLTPLQPTL